MLPASFFPHGIGLPLTVQLPNPSASTSKAVHPCAVTNEIAQAQNCPPGCHTDGFLRMLFLRARAPARATGSRALRRLLAKIPLREPFTAAAGFFSVTAAAGFLRVARRRLRGASGAAFLFGVTASRFFRPPARRNASNSCRYSTASASRRSLSPPKKTKVLPAMVGLLRQQAGHELGAWNPRRADAARHQERVAADLLADLVNGLHASRLQAPSRYEPKSYSSACHPHLHTHEHVCNQATQNQHGDTLTLRATGARKNCDSQNLPAAHTARAVIVQPI